MDGTKESEIGALATSLPIPNQWTPKGWEGLTAEQIEALGQMGRIAAGGLSVGPIAVDGSKATVGKWKQWQQNIAPPWQVMLWSRRGYGYAIICGVISGGLEVLDFDEPDLYAPWYWQCSSIIEHYDLPIDATPSGGSHVFWRCSIIGRSTKIAKSEAGKTLIETKAEGGYVIGPNNPRSVHPTGRLYLQVGGMELPAVPTIKPDERRHLLKTAAAFDRFGLREEHIRQKAKNQKAEQWRRTHSHQDTGFKVGDDFKAKATWPEVLEPHGWQYAGATFWTRPGGDRGAHSASINRAGDGTSVLAVFSSNAGALAPTIGDHATWDLFGAYAALNHGGDRVEAAKDLRRKGYGG